MRNISIHLHEMRNKTYRSCGYLNVVRHAWRHRNFKHSARNEQ